MASMPLVARFMTSWCSRVASPMMRAFSSSTRSSQRDARRRGPGQQIAHFTQYGCRRQCPAPLRGPARHGQDLVHQRLAATSRIEYRGDGLAQPRIVSGALRRHLTEAQDRAQDVVEVVSDAPGHRAQRLQFLRFAQLRIQHRALAHQRAHQQRRSGHHRRGIPASAAPTPRPARAPRQRDRSRWPCSTGRPPRQPQPRSRRHECGSAVLPTPGRE